MGNIFAGSEVVQIGVQIEQNGRDFYNTLAKQSKNPKIKEVFGFLAKEEEGHIKVFQGILDKTQKYEPQGLDADQYYAYLNSLASESVFTRKDKGKEIAAGIKSDKEAIEVGIGAEKDSIVFYEEIKKVVADYDAKVVEEVIGQEQGHLNKLLGLKAQV
ncbi:MAG: ferritin family protein [Candidatus Omnitrophica bacterium]|nr:ferritin family protein [Candidatus Omnitrophota bacterium]